MSNQSDGIPADSEKSVKVIPPRWRLEKWFPKLAADKMKLLRSYHKELLHFNKNLNLISSKTAVDADLIHFTDSIRGANILFKATSAPKIYDIGSGNGFPGVVMAILDPNREIVLLDSDKRKVEFLKHVIAHLGLKNVNANHGRVEDLPDHSVECAVSRAFAPISKSMLITRKIFSKNGKYFHFKSESWSTELLGIPVQLGRFWDPSLVESYVLPGVEFGLCIIQLVRTGVD